MTPNLKRKRFECLEKLLSTFNVCSIDGTRIAISNFEIRISNRSKMTPPPLPLVWQMNAKACLFWFQFENWGCLRLIWRKLRKMSTQRGAGPKRDRPQKHKNTFAFKNDLHDKTWQMKKINSLYVCEVCERCKLQIEWKIKYKKYKPLSQAKTCIK